jgi:hypothetical protein
MDKTQLTLFKSLFEANLPIFEKLIEDICTDYNLKDKEEEMKSKYLYKDRKKVSRALKKKTTFKKRNAYTMFLADKSYFDQIKKANPELSLKELNKIRCVRWKQLSNEEKEVYKQNACKYNKMSIEEREEYDKQLDKVVDKKEEIHEVVEDKKEEIDMRLLEQELDGEDLDLLSDED